MTTNHHETVRPDHVTHRLETSRQLAEWLGGELAHWAQSTPEGGHGSGNGRTGPAASGGAARRIDRLATQLARVCELVNLALTQADLDEDLGIAWILLEQARQQLGHAATSAWMIGPDCRLSEGEVEAEAGAMAQLVWFLQRDLMPWPGDASVVVDFGNGPDLVPDFRPDTPFELVPLQILANSAMTFNAGEAVQDPDDKVMAMAFGEYVWTIMAEAMDLLEFCAGQGGETGLAGMVETGNQVADLIGGAFPLAWQVFQGPAGFPDGAG